MKRVAAFLVASVLAVGVCVNADPLGDADDPLPEGCALRLGTSRYRHGIPISMLAVSIDGKLAAAVNGNNMLGATRMFDMATGKVLYTLGGWEGTSIEAAAISPDGQTLVTKQDFTLLIREAATGGQVRKIPLPRVVNGSYSRNEWINFTPDGKAIAVTSQGKVIHLIDFESGSMIREFSNDDPESTSSGFDTVLGIAISADSKLMASGGFCNEKDNYFARLWNVETGEELRRFKHGRSYGIAPLAFSPDGKMLATGAHDARLRLFDVDTGKLLKAFDKDGKRRMVPGCVAFSPDGKTVAAAAQSLRVYDASTSKEIWHLDRKATGLMFTDGGKTLTGAVLGAIYRWDAATGRALTPEGGDSGVEQIIVSADGSKIVTRGSDGDAHLWDGATGKHLRYISATWQRGLAMSPDGQFLVWPVADASTNFKDPQQPNMTYDGSRIRMYDIAADKFIERFPAFKGDAHDLKFIDEGKRLVTVDHRDGMVRIWNVEAGTEERSFLAMREENRKQSNAVWHTELSPDGKKLAVAYVLRQAENNRLGDLQETYPIRVWDMTTGEELQQFNPPARYVRNMAFSPDGQWLVSSGSAVDAIAAKSGQTFVWNATTGETAATLPNGSCAVAFSSDGRYLATATPDDVTLLWDTAGWSQCGEFIGHRDRPTALTFAPNRPLLFSGSVDTTVLGWDLSKR